MKGDSKNRRVQTAGSKSRSGDSSFISHHSSDEALKGRELLDHLLSDINQYPARRDEIEHQIREAFERRVAILALDMVGFSRLTIEYGIIHYLAMIHQMTEGARPAIYGNGGKVIKQEADNIFAVFDTPAQALEAALDILRAFDAINSVVPADRDIFGSVGIGFGEALIIGEADMFGSEMNLACKLGEDLAGKSEILLTAAAYAALPARRYICEPMSFSISELNLNCYRFEKRVVPKSGRR